MFMAALNGCNAVTMNLFDMVGSPTDEEPRYGRMLQQLKPRLNVLSSASEADAGCPRGVSVPFAADFADAMPAGAYDCMYQGDFWMPILAGCGVPVGINLPEATAQAICGDAIQMWSDEKVDQALHKGLILDGRAAAILLQRGFGSLLGIDDGESFSKTSLILGAERWNQEYLALRMVCEDTEECVLHRFKPLAQAHVLSELVNYRHQVLFPRWILFENQYGGRCAIYTAEMARRPSLCFMNWKRRRQMQQIVTWLWHDQPVLLADGGAWMVPGRRDRADCTDVSLLNLDLDPWDSIQLRMAMPKASSYVFQVLQQNGQWQEIQPTSLSVRDNTLTADFDICTPAMECTVIRVKTQN